MTKLTCSLFYSMTTQETMLNERNFLKDIITQEKNEWLRSQTPFFQPHLHLETTVAMQLWRGYCLQLAKYTITLSCARQKFKKKKKWRKEQQQWWKWKYPAGVDVVWFQLDSFCCFLPALFGGDNQYLSSSLLVFCLTYNSIFREWI